MKHTTIIASLLLSLCVLLSSCEAIAGIFKAGMWTGIIGVILVVVLIIWLVSRATKK